MILVRNTFRLKFGMAKPAVAALKEGVMHVQRVARPAGPMRILTDVTGEFYTVVLELTFPDMQAFEQGTKQVFGDPQWQAAYQKFTPFVESGRREIFNIVDVGAGATV